MQPPWASFLDLAFSTTPKNGEGNLGYNYQSFSVMPTPESMTPERPNQQIALVNQLLSVTSDPTGIQTLQQAKMLLSTPLAEAAETIP